MKVKVRFPFYKARIDGELLDDTIAIVTALFPVNWKRGWLRHWYSHVEFWLPDKNGNFVDEYGNIVGMCFSSTTRGGAKGVRMWGAKYVLKHPERWDYIEAEVDEGDFKRVRELMKLELHKKYDYSWLFSFLIPFFKEDPNKWGCSELIGWTAFELKVLKKIFKKKTDPRKLARLLEESLNCLTKPLSGEK